MRGVDVPLEASASKSHDYAIQESEWIVYFVKIVESGEYLAEDITFELQQWMADFELGKRADAIVLGEELARVVEECFYVIDTDHSDEIRHSPFFGECVKKNVEWDKDPYFSLCRYPFGVKNRSKK